MELQYSTLSESVIRPNAIRTRGGRATRNTYFLIANPASRNGRAGKRLRSILAELEHRGARYELQVCESLEHATRLSEQANRAGYEVVVGIGGDGTLNRVMNGFFDAEGSRISLARFGAIHIGTSPDFCRSYGVPLAVREAVETVLGGVSREIRVGRVVCSSDASAPGGPTAKPSYFACCANVGLGASLARMANRGVRRYAGDFLGTFLSLLRVLTQYRPQSLELERDGQRQRIDNVYNLAVGKTRFIASGLKLRHDLKPGDEHFYILCLRDVVWTRLPQILWTLYRARPIGADGCLSLTYGKNIQISPASGAVELEFDGDPAGWCPCQIETAPAPLDVLVGDPKC